ncbi:hypothetical protein P40081_31615 [Paenibacillus sp. FSL P4-0081]|uniref:hypothetical protein n=1 Tax=Paenibacillus sp. FSL P4-0081 TaxID=1536769 RepID=UPI0004F8C4D5|nr:hypothetical protein [Paenibacillus sp. FSL P4-0081]AIQ32167.1 hypothetical protein P40081_31615 [Paenibacillus sp. FSL P4-0081]
MLKLTRKMKVIAASGILLIALLMISWGVYAKPVHAALVNYSSMVEVAPDVYIEPDMSKELQDQLLSYVELAQEKVTAIFGERTSTPYLIVALTSRSLGKYTENPTGQTYYLPWNNYIVIGPDGFNENVISHEFTHAELRERLRNRNVVPVWFDEGLASMVDGRLSNSTAAWEQVTDKGKKPVDYGLLDSYDAFSYGTPEAWKNYNLACYEVTRWFSRAGEDGLLKLIQALNQGEDFAEQYARIELAEP